MEVIDFDRSLDIEAHQECFRRYQRVHIPGILNAGSADALADCLLHQVPWKVAINDKDQQAYANPEQFLACPKSEQDALDRQIIERVRGGFFQYRYRCFQLTEPDLESPRPDLLTYQAVEMLNSPAFLAFARSVTGIEALRGATAQATLYQAGDFLTQHTDVAVKKNRKVAYVLNLTRFWRPYWVGILQFFDEQGHVASGFTPCFNALNMMAVPCSHAVSYVAPFAGKVGRYSITGWLFQ